VCEQTINVRYIFCVLFIVFSPVVLHSMCIRSYHICQTEESQPLLTAIVVDQIHTNTILPCTKKMLKALFPLEIWHTIMGYLEGNNSFLNTVFARIFIPTDHIRKNILASFNSYLTRVSPEQRIKALGLFYTTVRYVSQHNILGRTASLTQPLIQTVARTNFNAACTLVPELSSLPTKHALYLINHCRRLTENHKVYKHLGMRPVCCHCLYLTVGLTLIFASMFDFARITDFTSEYKRPALISGIALLYALCYSFVYYRHLSCFNALEQFLENLEQQVKLITSPKTTTRVSITS
jgi:hypothetical protein